MPSSPLLRKADLILLFLVALFVYLHAFKPPFTPFFYESDQLIFLYDADRMIRGDLIYRDFFQFTLPGTQLLYLLLFSIFGSQYFVVGLVIIAIGVTFFLLTLAISREVITDSFAYLPPVIFVFFGMRWFGMDGTHRMLSPIFILLAVWALMRGTSVLNSTAAGAFCAVASFITQPRGVYALFGFCVFLGLSSYFEKDSFSSLIRKLGAAGLGFFITLGALCSYFIYTVGLDTVIYSTITYPMGHYGLHPENGSSEFFVELSKALQISAPQQVFKAAAALLHALIFPVTPLIVAIKLIASRRHFSWSESKKPVLLLVIAAVSYLGISGPVHMRFYTVSAPAIILFVWLFSDAAFIQRLQRSIARVLVPAVVVLGLFMVVSWQLRTEVTTVELPAGRVAVVEPNEPFGRYLWLKDHTKPGDEVYEVSEPYIYFPLQLRNPTKIGQIFSYGYTPSSHVDSVLGDLRKSPPRYIVWDNSYNIEDTLRRRDDPTGPLSAYVVANYLPVGPVYDIDSKPFQVWERRSGVDAGEK